MAEALIFDVDGTLAETEEAHRHAFNDAFAEAGLGWHWSRDDYRRLLTTTGGKERMARHARESGLDPEALDIPALHRAKTALYTRALQRHGIALRPGIAALIAEARAAGMRLGIATTTSRANVEALSLAAFGRPADQMFDALACGDEVPVKKPAPHVYLLALSRLGVWPDQAIAFEDSRNGLRAAREAGIACIVSPSLYTEGEDFAGALCVTPGFDRLGGLQGIAKLKGPHHV